MRKNWKIILDSLKNGVPNDSIKKMKDMATTASHTSVKTAGMISNVAAKTVTNTSNTIASTTASVRRTTQIVKYSLLLLSGGIFLYGTARAIESISKLDKD